jgi:N-formylglutamate deformylase
VTAPFQILRPEGATLPLVVGIPHTGTELPTDVAARLRPEMRGQPMCDWHLHHLYAGLPALGITVVHAVYSRFLTDLNRPPDAAPLYPGRFETGLVPTQTFQGDEIWLRPPAVDEIDAWRAAYHAPYHTALAGILDEFIAARGRVWFVDAHSVASAASRLHGELTDDIYLGDRDGATNDGRWTDAVASGFAQQGYRVVRNSPYKGGYNTAHYGARSKVEAVQVEMVQRCYMDEADPDAALTQSLFAVMQAQLVNIFGDLAAHVSKEIPA